MVLADEIHRRYPSLPLLGVSVVSDPEVVDWFNEYGVGYFLKSTITHRELLRRIESILLPSGSTQSPRCFIVHGHDHEALFELKNYLQNVLGFDEPIVLREQPSLGKTIIETRDVRGHCGVRGSCVRASHTGR